MGRGIRAIRDDGAVSGSSFHGSGIESDSLYRETTKKQDDLHFAYSQNTPPGYVGRCKIM